VLGASGIPQSAYASAARSGAVRTIRSALWGLRVGLRGAWLDASSLAVRAAPIAVYDSGKNHAPYSAP